MVCHSFVFLSLLMEIGSSSPSSKEMDIDEKKSF